MDWLRLQFRRAAASARGWRRVTARIPRGRRLGIAARLSIAFFAVTLLAVAANQIAERGSSLLRAMSEAPVAAPAPDTRTAEGLPAALDQFQRAVLTRVESSAAPRRQSKDEASLALEAARAAHLAALRPTIDDAILTGLDAQASAHAQLDEQLVRSADTRRRLLNELDIEYEALDVRIKSSLDRVWAVFGKVIGRDYLLEASRTLDELGRHLDDLGDLHGYGQGTVRAITLREKAFSALLAENEASIERVLGAEWLAQTRAGL